MFRNFALQKPEPAKEWNNSFYPERNLIEPDTSYLEKI
jgi:hypothetical protein